MGETATAKRKSANRAIIAAIKQDAECMDCGVADLPDYCYDFDHRDPSTKKWAVGTMISHKRSTKMLLEEIAKCDIVCANCHRIRTHETPA